MIVLLKERLQRLSAPFLCRKLLRLRVLVVILICTSLAAIVLYHAQHLRFSTVYYAKQAFGWQHRLKERSLEEHLRELVERAHGGLAPDITIPLVITPIFHDADTFPRMLFSINVPVRQFVFILNSLDEELLALGEIFARIPYGVHVVNNSDNVGFAASINQGLRYGLHHMLKEECPWFFIVNCDVKFPKRTLKSFTLALNWDLDTRNLSMIYGPGVDHYAFAVTRHAVQQVGLMDENFYPAYFEDIDWRWRMNLAGFDEKVLDLPIWHLGSLNLQRREESYISMHMRGSGGWIYGRLKWGPCGPDDIHARFPPSGYRWPFNISYIPLSRWFVDSTFVDCIKHGNDMIWSHWNGACWFNGTATLQPFLTHLGVINYSFPGYLHNPHFYDAPSDNRTWNESNWRWGNVMRIFMPRSLADFFHQEAKDEGPYPPSLIRRVFTLPGNHSNETLIETGPIRCKLFQVIPNCVLKG